MELEIDQLRKETAGLVREVESLWSDNAHLKICKDNAIKRVDSLVEQNAELEVALKILASSPCETCPQAAGGLCHESDLVCAEARIKWAKRKAKGAA